MRVGLLVVLVCLGTILANTDMRASTDQEIRKKERALQKLRKEIDAYEARIRESEKREKVTLDRIDDYEMQTNLIRSLLEGLVEEESRLQTGIDQTMNNIDFLERQISMLKLHYAHYVASVYRTGRVYDFETLLSSNSLNQLYIRIEYLRRFSDQHRSDLEQIADKKSLLLIEQSLLQQRLSERRQVIADKKHEQDVLAVKTEKRKKALHEIRRDKSAYKKELDRKTKAAQALEGLIADLVERERIRKEHEAELARERARKEREAAGRTVPVPVEETPSPEGLAFARMRGKLPWPVSGGHVVAEFGTQVHPVLHTVTQNAGIDIAVPSGTPIRSVADGEVAMIHWLPSYGNLIILNHHGGYRTVYTHLSDISVIEGQKVKGGTMIARCGDSIGGSLLHFELWKEKDKQDPEGWLRRR